MDIKNTEGQYFLVQREVVAAERSFEQAKGMCGKTESTFMIEGWMPTSKVAPVTSN